MALTFKFILKHNINLKYWNKCGNMREGNCSQEFCDLPLNGQSLDSLCSYTMLPSHTGFPYACFSESIIARLPSSKQGDFHIFTGQRRQLCFSVPYFGPYCTVDFMGMSTLLSYWLQSVSTDPNPVDSGTPPKCYFKQYIFRLLSLYSAWKYRNN